MEITQHLEQEIHHVRLSGAFTFTDHAGFRDVLNVIGEGSVQQVTIHMAQVNFVDSAALGMLLLARDEAEKYRKQLVLRGAAGQVKKMFDMARFNMLFSLD